MSGRRAISDRTSRHGRDRGGQWHDLEDPLNLENDRVSDTMDTGSGKDSIVSSVGTEADSGRPGELEPELGDDPQREAAGTTTTNDSARAIGDQGEDKSDTPTNGTS